MILPCISTTYSVIHYSHDAIASRRNDRTNCVCSVESIYHNLKISNQNVKYNLPSGVPYRSYSGDGVRRCSPTANILIVQAATPDIIMHWQSTLELVRVPMHA